MWQFKRSLELDGKEDASRMSLSVDPGAPAESHIRLLHKAASKGDLAGAKRALAAGAGVDSPSPEGQAALIIAAAKGHAAVLEFLLAKGAAVDLKSVDGKTALHICSAQGAQSSVEALLANGAEIHCKDSSFLAQTALHYAAANGHASVVQLLLNKGAMLDLECFMGTALQLAAQNNHAAVVALLLQSNAAANKQDKQGRTALHMAADAGLVSIVDALVKGGANVLLRDDQGKTALQLAKMKQADFRSRPFGSQFAAFTSIVTKLQQIRVPAREAEEVMRASLEMKRTPGGHLPSSKPITATPTTAADKNSATVQPALASSLYHLTVPKESGAANGADSSSSSTADIAAKQQATGDPVKQATADGLSKHGDESAAPAVKPPAAVAGQTVRDQVKRMSNTADDTASAQCNGSNEISQHAKTASMAALPDQDHSSQIRSSGDDRKSGEGQPAAANSAQPTAAVAEAKNKHVSTSEDMAPNQVEGQVTEDSSKAGIDHKQGTHTAAGAAPSSAGKPTAASAGAFGSIDEYDDEADSSTAAARPAMRRMSSSQQSAAAAHAFGLPDTTQADYIPVASPHARQKPPTNSTNPPNPLANPPASPGRHTAPATLGVQGSPQQHHALHAAMSPDSIASPRRATALAASGSSSDSKQTRGQVMVSSLGGCVKPSGFFAGQMPPQQWAISANHASAQPAVSGKSSGASSSPRKSLELLKAQLAKVQEHQAHIEQQLDGVKSHLQDLEQQEYFTEAD